ncbi:hypothetical protein LC612_04280 [Nostoc sp. CHAB 5834]|nr:hypothetical protein [Nostoc sp. CHAB 5834]
MVSPGLLLFVESLGVVLGSNIGTTSDASDVYDGLRLRIFGLHCPCIGTANPLMKKAKMADVKSEGGVLTELMVILSYTHRPS